MEESNSSSSENIIFETETVAEVHAIPTLEKSVKHDTNGNMSANLFPESPVYDPEDIEELHLKDQHVSNGSSNGDEAVPSDKKVSQSEMPLQVKRKLSDEQIRNSPKIQKLDSQELLLIDTQILDNEVSELTSSKINAHELLLPSSRNVRTPVRSSPRRVKRSNSTESPITPRWQKTRPASADVTCQRKTPKKIDFIKTFKTIATDEVQTSSDSSIYKPSTEIVKEIPNPTCDTIPEESSSDMNDSQNFHLVLSPTPDDNNSEEVTKICYNSDPVVVKDRVEVINAGSVPEPRSEGYNYSDQSSNFSQPLKAKDTPKDKTTDQESTDSMSISMDSPDIMPVASKLISKLSNGNSSTPTELALENKHVISISDNDSDATPDMLKINGKKTKREKHESFKMSNSTTPSTISPVQNGHSLPMSTPQIPTFDVHLSHNEDGEFLSLYIVRTDNDVGMDMCKEYQRFSKRFTIDPYMGDISVSNSPSSVTSTGMVNLPNRTSFASTTSSTSTTSNRTSDGNFVVPQPPRKSISNPSSSTVKGCDGLFKKIHDIFSHVREFDETNKSTNDEKVSVGIQASPCIENSLSTNGNASPEEIGKCDKATPKSSLKKTRVRGRRPMAGKTKRAILPTQIEEPEYMHGMNSPEMVPNNSDNGRTSPKPSRDDKPLSSLVATPKSISKLKKKGRPTSPRPATPVEKTIKQEYAGYTADTVVLAKWVDKRYYSGKVLEITEPNKYLIKFDDGQSKALLDDFIIFGDTKTLPLQGQSVYAMIDEDQSYEPGLVLGVEENDSGTIIYRCTTDGDTTVCVTASELYVTEDQAKSIKESIRNKSPSSMPSTPRRRGLRELDLDNIIQGPRSARTRDKGSSSARKRVNSPKSPKASTSGMKSKTPLSRKRLASESSEMSESSNSAPIRIEEVAGVEPEVQKTPRKIDGVKAGPLQLKGATKQNIGKKNSKLTKFENDEATVSQVGPIPAPESKLFTGLHFLLTCTEPPRRNNGTDKQSLETRHYSSEEDGETTSTMVTDTEDLEFTDKPFNKERLKEQLETGGGTVYSHFDDVPKAKYSVCKLIAPRPCLTAKYIQCIAADIRAISHAWIIACCTENTLLDSDAFALPAGWAITKQRFVNWAPSSGKRNTSFFKDKLILLCGDQDTFVKFWDRACTLAGANTKIVNEENLNMSGAIACVTEWDCPHEVQNKANQDNIPLVSTTWVVQCLIEAKVIPPTSHDKFSFMYTEPE